MRPRFAFALLGFFGLVCPAPSPALEPPMNALERRLDELCRSFEGEVGYCIRRLSDGVGAERRADELFPTASLIKVPLLLRTATSVEAGQRQWSDLLSYDPGLIDYEPGDDLLARVKPGEKIELWKLAALMVSFSDNHASLWLQALGGGGGEINAWLQTQGLQATRVNSRTAGREKEKAAFGWGQTTPREMASIFRRLAEPGGWANGRVAERALRLLSRSHVDTEAVSVIPVSVAVASKQGAVDRSRSEAMLVFAPGGTFVFCLITRNQRDERYTPDNAGWVLLREAAKAAWDFFEPAR